VQQIKGLTHVRYGYHTIPRTKLINRLSELFPGNLRKLALNNEVGRGALEGAIKLAMVNKPGATTFPTACSHAVFPHPLSVQACQMFYCSIYL
jgi:acetylornithine/succinyldiaminopimelate/putrescine aminotransferase